MHVEQPPELTRSPQPPRRVTVARTPEELEGISEVWERLQGSNIITDPHFFRVSLEADPRIERPHVVHLERDGGSVLAVGRIERVELPVKVGYRRLFGRKVRSLTVVYGGLLGDPTTEELEALLDVLDEALARGEADTLTFRYLEVGSRAHAVVQDRFRGSRQARTPEPDVHWSLELADSVDGVLQRLSSKTRQTFTRYSRRLERDFGDRLEVRIFDRPEELDVILRDIEVVARKTYQWGLGVAFGDTPAHRRRTAATLERGWFKAYVLYVDGSPIAFRYGECYRGTYRDGRPGYDPAYADERPGNYLLLRTIDELCRDPGVSVFDLGIGDAEYKRRICTDSWREETLIVVARRPGLVAFNGVRNGLLWVVSRLDRVAARTGMRARIKRLWRDRLRSEPA